ncbi:MAG TPA: hypothetical protein VLT86_05670 [Vicinamibacterales bacterium]|nr:hypothetical protein [Vicinamibacterales bacterium]
MIFERDTSTLARTAVETKKKTAGKASQHPHRFHNDFVKLL